MNNYKLKIQYDGTNYAGWQIQQDNDTIQQRISDAIRVIIKEDINLIGSGRTDSGVHAFGQAANFRTDQELDIYKFRHSLNSILPKDISIIDMIKADENFHARFDAKKRSYLYFITQYKSPFYQRYSYYYHSSVDLIKLNRLSGFLIREDDFTSFTKKSSDIDNKNCIIYNARWTERKGIIIFLIEANRYLHGMVRALTGTLLTAVKNNYDESFIEEVISAKERGAAGESVPAKGLFLYKVKY